MNYRELYNLYSGKVEDIRTAIRDTSGLIRDYKQIINGENENIEKIFNKIHTAIFSELFVTRIDDQFSAKTSEFFGLNHDRTIKQLTEKLSKVRDAQEQFDILSEQIENIVHRLDSTERDFKANRKQNGSDLDEIHHLRTVVSMIDELMEDSRVTYDFIQKSKGAGVFASMFGTLKNDVKSKTISINERIKSSKTLNGDFFETPKLISEQAIQELDNAEDRIEHYRLEKAERAELGSEMESLKRQQERLNETIHSLTDHNVAKEFISHRINQKLAMLKGEEYDNFVNLYGGLSATNRIKTSKIKIETTKKIIEGLEDQLSQMESMSRSLEPGLSKLRTAKSRAGSSKVKGFDASDFTLKMDGSINHFRTRNQWASRQHNMINSTHYDYSMMSSSNMLMWFMLMDTDMEDNMAGVFFQDHIAEIQESIVPEAIALASSGVEIDIPNLDMEQISNLSESMPDISDLGGTLDTAAFSMPEVELPKVEVAIPEIETPVFETPSFETPSVPTYDTPTIDTGGDTGGCGGFD